ncbi:amino acid ABC transporter permease [Streptomyces sp. NBC_00572]|uniref:amino acid ABC transporter permease n=1 Tax=Streptomyces sp. NBC_00572 TaxID=2903664 RepID=UPI0022504DA0|nr:amino acid ABC transporter permease [Streptomyces sp. NBC_00572]MCX4983891.1 amino acid ABC transporter permease [Streptomyces sp. NBC_00572]
MSSVLYDTPGPRAKRRNVIYTIVFLAVFGLVAWWVLAALADKNQLDADKWSPFVTDSRVWTTYLLPGLTETLKAAALSILIALPLGALLGIGRLSDHRWVRVPVGTAVEFFRAIPVLLLMMFAAALYREFTTISSDFRPLYAVVTGLVLYNASVIAEVVRAGVLSLPRGQGDAAEALGMRKGQTMLYVLLPQAVTVMLPALVSQLVVIVKDTALGGALLGFAELLSQNRQITANYGANTIATFTVIALIYIVINAILTSLAGRLEKRLRRGKKSAAVNIPAQPGATEVKSDAVSGA